MDKLDDFGMDREKEWEPDTDRPWNEKQWEEFLQENERLMDRYEKVMKEDGALEKYKYPLDLYYKVHYDLDPMNLCEGRDCQKCDDKDECETYYLVNVSGKEEEPLSEEDKRIIEAEREEDKKQLESIDCYRSALKFDNLIKEFLKNFNLNKEWEDETNIFVQLSMQAFKVHANILGGHCFGYDDDVLCANIVKCKWAIKNIESAINIIEVVKAKYPNLLEQLTRLKNEAQLVKKDIILWIETLKTKVWWV